VLNKKCCVLGESSPLVGQLRGEHFYKYEMREDEMQILKNIVIFIVSVLSISLLIIIFDQLGMNKKLNLFLSALLYGVFITIYLQKVFLSLSYFLGFYSLLFMISYSVEVIVMLFISCSVLLIIKMIMPKLKDTHVDRFFILNKLYKK
jgi:hypothetical protein